MGGAHQTRITAISSGASLRPIASWSAYCVAKAGLDMWVRCVAEEGKHNNISAIAVSPGVVDTGMQADIRSVESRDLPEQSKFVELYTSGQLAKSDQVAAQLLPLITAHRMDQ